MPAHAVPHCTHTSAPKSTSLLTLVSKSVALVQDHPDTHKYMPFSAQAVWSLTKTLCPAVTATQSIVCVPESVIFAVVATTISCLDFTCSFTQSIEDVSVSLIVFT